jgi:hypothetical protein
MQCLLGLCVLLSASCFGAEDQGLKQVWPEIRKQVAVLKASGGGQDAVEKARNILKDNSIGSLASVPADQKLELAGKVCAAMLIVGERGDHTDMGMVLPYIPLEIPNPALFYDKHGMGLGGFNRVAETNLQQRFPACFALGGILKRNPQAPPDALIKFVDDEKTALKDCVRVLGVLSYAKSPASDKVAERISIRFGSRPGIQSDLERVKQGAKAYWDEELLSDSK